MGIGTLNEGQLHAELKALIAEPGDLLEHPIGRYVVDIVRGNLLIEIQTANFAAMGAKLDRLLDAHEVRIVHPVAETTWLVKPDGSRRRSPIHGSVYSVFDELVRLPTLLDHPNLSVEVIIITEFAHRVHDPKRRRGRGGWRVERRELGEVIERRVFGSNADLVGLLPDMEEPFTTADLAGAAGIDRGLAQRMCYCLRSLELIEDVGRSRAGVAYRRAT